MKKRNILSALRQIVYTLHGKSPDKQITLYRIAGIGANGRKVPAHIRGVETDITYQPETNNKPKKLSRSKHFRRGKIEKNISKY